MFEFTVERLSFETLAELPAAWQNADYLALLGLLSYDNPEALPAAELKPMALMALTDLEPTEAAELVLGYLLGEQLSAGQIQNLAHNMLTEKLWEENPELGQHQAFFNATQLLYEAYNGKFPRAEAVRFQVQLTATDPAGLAIFDQQPEAPLLRLLAPGMPDNTLLRRLFSEQLAGPRFPEARHIIWQLKPVTKVDNAVSFEVVSSAYWLDDFKYADTYQAATAAEEEAAEETTHA